MAVLRPIKLTITNYPEGQSETFDGGEQPQPTPTPAPGQITFSRHLYMESDDFLETPVPKYKRLYPGGPECRLKGAYLITLHRLRQGRGRATWWRCWRSTTRTAGAATPPTAGR